MITQINEGAAIERQSQGGKVKFSTFPYGAPFAKSDRYGEYGIVDIVDIVPDDNMTVYLPSDTKSPGLKAPLMQRPNKKQDAFFVPLQAIIPNSHDYLIANPLKGDDVPQDCNTVVEEFENKIRTRILDEVTRINTGIANETLVTKGISGKWMDTGLFARILNLANFIDMMYSPGSLLTAIGRPLRKLFRWTKSSTANDQYHNVGGWYDDLIRRVKNASNNGYFLAEINGDDVKIVLTDGYTKPGELDIRTFLYMLRDDPSINFDFGEFDETELIADDELITEFSIGIKEYTENSPNTFNYSRAIAYQLICSHFYSNDKIDYIYTAELWRQNLGSLVQSLYGGIEPYNYNGIDILYDWTSGYYMTDILNNYPLTQTYEYFRLIFGWNRSLRFIDYFTGARTEPLAVGNTDVAVNDGMVSILDVTRNIQKQRWLNAINKVGQRWESQIKKLFGKEPKPDYHNPFWLAHTKDMIGESQTENTGAEQYDIPSNSNKLVAVTGQFVASNKFAFDCSFDRYGVMMVINYYDIPRLYTDGIDPFTKKATRFDMFNPYMQYIGDQEIYSDELIMDESNSEIFGYAGTDMEYKTRYGKAMGAFIYNLPGYAFLADKKRPYGPNAVAPHIGPSYIRSIETEFDEFYQSLTGYSLDSYFHFITLVHSTIEAKRPMVYNPQILD